MVCGAKRMEHPVGVVEGAPYLSSPRECNGRNEGRVAGMGEFGRGGREVELGSAGQVQVASLDETVGRTMKSGEREFGRGGGRWGTRDGGEKVKFGRGGGG